MSPEGFPSVFDGDDRNLIQIFRSAHKGKDS